jgi:hypothetical protein
MAIEVDGGTPLPLNLITSDGSTTVFPVAHVYTQSGTEVAGSPFALTPIGAYGYYSDSSYITQVSDLRLVAVYIIYEDSLHTIESGIYNHAEDVFDILDPSGHGNALEGLVNNYKLSVPQVLEIPSSGSTQYMFALYTFDIDGHPADVDSQQAYIHIEEAVSKAALISNASMTREQLGVYWYLYTIPSNMVEEKLWVEFVFNGNSVPYLAGQMSETSRIRSVLNTIDTIKLTTARANNLDLIDTTISSRQSTAIALSQYNTLLGDIISNGVGIDALNTLLLSISSVLNAVKIESDKIGNPIYGTLALDNIAAYSQLLKIGIPSSGTLAGDLSALSTKVGTPAGISVSSDIANIKSDTIKIGPTTFGSITADIAAIETKLGTPIGISIAADIATLDGDISSINTKLGTPFSGTISGDILDVDTEIDGLILNLTPTRISKLDNLDVVVSSRATQSSLDTYYNSLNVNDAAILAAVGSTPNNTTFVGIVPPVLVLPDAIGSKTYRFFVNLFDKAGQPQDADTLTINRSIKDISGATILGSSPMTRDGIGRYHTDYSVDYSDTPRPLYIFFNYLEGGTSFEQIRMTEVEQYQVSLDTLTSLLTPARAANLDNLNAPVSSLQFASTALTQYNNLLTGETTLATLISSVLTRIGVPTVSLESDLQNILNFASKIGNPIHGTIAADAIAIQTQVDKIGPTTFGSVTADIAAIETKMGTPSFGTIASDIAGVRSEVNNIGTPTFGSIANDISNLKSTVTGPIASQISNVQSTTDNLVTKIGTPVVSVSADIGSVASKIGTPVLGTVSLDIAEIAAETDMIGTPLHGTVAADALAIENKLNTSILNETAIQNHLNTQDTNIAAIKSDTSKIGPSTFGSISADIANTYARIGTPIRGSISADIAAITIDPSLITDILTLLTTIQSEIGIPTTTLANELQEVINQVALIPTNPLLTTDPRLTNLDATISSRATPSDVQISGGGGSGGYSSELVGIIDPSSSEYELLGIVESI